MLGIDFKKRSASHAVAILLDDHKRVKVLFEEFEKTDSAEEQKRIALQAIHELKTHATLEEEIFYPAVRKAIPDKEDIMNEADEEHHVAKVLIAELEGMDGDESHYHAKFLVLAENVRHHIKEEEAEMLPKAEDTKIDFERLGKHMMLRKHQLLTRGFPKTGEEQMVASSHGRGDSPAKNASKTAARAPKKRG